MASTSGGAGAVIPAVQSKRVDIGSGNWPRTKERTKNAVLLRAIADGDTHLASSLAEDAISEFETIVRKVL